MNNVTGSAHADYSFSFWIFELFKDYDTEYIWPELLELYSYIYRIMKCLALCIYDAYAWTFGTVEWTQTFIYNFFARFFSELKAFIIHPALSLTRTPQFIKDFVSFSYPNYSPTLVYEYKIAFLISSIIMFTCIYFLLTDRITRRSPICIRVVAAIINISPTLAILYSYAMPAYGASSLLTYTLAILIAGTAYALIYILYLRNPVKMFEYFYVKFISINLSILMTFFIHSWRVVDYLIKKKASNNILEASNYSFFHLVRTNPYLVLNSLIHSFSYILGLISIVGLCAGLYLLMWYTITDLMKKFRRNSYGLV